MEGKTVKESISEYAEFALPTDANGLGNVLGGKVMHLVDLAAAMAAMRHARKPTVTAAVDSLRFLYPAHIGDLITLRSSVNRVFRTSMEIGVSVETENLMTGAKIRNTLLLKIVERIAGCECAVAVAEYELHKREGVRKGIHTLERSNVDVAVSVEVSNHRRVVLGLPKSHN